MRCNSCGRVVCPEALTEIFQWDDTMGISPVVALSASVTDQPSLIAMIGRLTRVHNVAVLEAAAWAIASVAGSALVNRQVADAGIVGPLCRLLQVRAAAPLCRRLLGVRHTHGWWCSCNGVPGGAVKRPRGGCKGTASDFEDKGVRVCHRSGGWRTGSWRGACCVRTVRASRASRCRF